MNTIPTTFKESLPSYTAVGGAERRASTGLSAVVLNRGGRYPRYTFFEELEKAGFDYILTTELSSRYDLESLSGNFPFIRFILLKEAISAGEEINLAAAELDSPLFFVLWNDVKFLRSGGAERMAERLLSTAAWQQRDQEEEKQYKRLCTVPQIQDNSFRTIPTLIAPALIPGENSIKTIPFASGKEGAPSLYPFDGIGIYDRDRFIRMGGFDSSIKSFHWQLMDFGFRSCLWGEEIAFTQLIKLSYENAVPLEDGTADENSRRFYLKNISPVFRGDYSYLPLRRFIKYVRIRGGELPSAWKEFSAARVWVKTNSYRFTSDARTVVERWESLDTLNSGSEDTNEQDDLSLKDEPPTGEGT